MNVAERETTRGLLDQVDQAEKGTWIIYKHCVALEQWAAVHGAPLGDLCLPIDRFDPLDVQRRTAALQAQLADAAMDEKPANGKAARVPEIPPDPALAQAGAH